MFGNSKPTASLSSGLLARKGHARPAMRPQGFVGLSPTALEDLGWNDMGDHAPPMVDPVALPPIAAVPPVLREREALAEELSATGQASPAVETTAAAPQPELEPQSEPEAAEPARNPLPVAKARRIQRESAARGPKAAFTLRLDSDRHLRLRLASAVCGRSAQALVTQALDAFLETVPDVEELARQLPVSGNR